jgi:putative transposase
MTAVAETPGVARSNRATRARGGEAPSIPARRGRPPAPEGELLARIRTVIGDLPANGHRPACSHRWVHAILRRQARERGAAAPTLASEHVV